MWGGAGGVGVIAALYVQPHGVYSRMPDVDVWPEDRDARTYAGPWSVVAHPPCERWSRLAHIHKHRPGKALGDDGGCFVAAVRDVETWGGVLEHPAGSEAWPTFRLPEPPATGGWVRCLWRPGWACHVEQGHYGHAAPKATWLYYVGSRPPPDLLWGPSGATGRIDLMPSQGTRRSATPQPFARLLVDLARQARGGE